MLDLEQPTKLKFWFKNGCSSWSEPRIPATTELSIGRTNSKRALGFVVSRDKTHIDFVLDKDQVAELAAYLQLQLNRLQAPRGRKREQLSLISRTKSPRALREWNARHHPDRKA